MIKMQFNLEAIFIYNAIFGAVLLANAVILLYVKKLQDERYIQVLTKAVQVPFIFLMVALPIVSILHLMNVVWFEASAGITLVWIVSITILYLSSYYYYKR